ncbi:caspase-8-like [Pelmatolapia mariae]|uniref:caspase-8-like n=1 Tax=Pelmatolapia mariae TaxID=158779 RepID=UPI002FE6866B
MSAEDTVRRNKTAIQTILSGDYRLILNKVFENFLITRGDYINLKSINGKDVEGHVTELVDKIMSKGDDTCRAFLNLLQTDEKIQTTFPQLNNTPFLPKPDQASLLQHDGSSQMESIQACAGGSRSVIQSLYSTLEDELDSTEVAALCFLCRDVVSRSHLKGITNIKDLFSRLKEKGALQNNHFLSQLLSTIDRVDLVRSLGIDGKRSKDTDESPVLSQYRVMLYKLYDAMINDNLAIMKFLLRSKLGKNKLDQCKTVLDVFAEMEKKDLISHTNVSVLHDVLQKLDNQELAKIVENYIQGIQQQQQQMLPPHRFFDKNEFHLPLSVTETQSTCRGEIIYTDARSQPISLPDQSEYYTLTHKSHGLCVVINNEIFTGTNLNNRRGTQKDADALNTVFTRLGFKVLIHNNLTAAQMQNEIRMYSKRNFVNDDALVVCVLSHGEKGCVFGTDGEKVFLQDMMLPFTSGRTPTLAGKPKLFFIEASQSDGYEKGHCPSSLGPGEEREKQFFLEGNSEADFLIGMATVKGFISFRNKVTGCIYTQELCRQLTRSAESQEMDDLLTVLTRVNREVHQREFYQNYKQMPEARYTLTKKLVLKSVSPDCDQK